MNTLDETKLTNMLQIREMLIAGILYRQTALDQLEASIAEQRATIASKPIELSVETK